MRNSFWFMHCEIYLYFTVVYLTSLWFILIWPSNENEADGLKLGGGMRSDKYDGSITMEVSQDSNLVIDSLSLISNLAEYFISPYLHFPYIFSLFIRLLIFSFSLAFYSLFAVFSSANSSL